MRYDETKMTQREINSELERYYLEEEEQIAEAYRQIVMFYHSMFVEFLDGIMQLLEEREQAQIRAEEEMCWREYEVIKQAEKDKAEFEMAIALLDDSEIPDKDEDASEDEATFEDEDASEDEDGKDEKRTDEASEEEDEKDPFVEMSEYKNPHNGISYRRKQARRIKRELISKAIAADKELVQRAEEDNKNKKPAVRMAVEKKPKRGETRKHCECTKYNHSYKSQAARAGRLRKAAEKIVPELNEFSQKHLEEVWEKKAEAREAQLVAKLAEKEAAKQTA